ncbi:helix-hairpin-helix domain-containing protein [Halopenitus sp. H-Gu1]|uniref:DNA polymerase Y family protein n=1 Tax=Halopenitus sp. H-Gu1 TaxID=3242697 RepID=UPI00359E7D27
MASGTLPGADPDGEDADRVVLHVDMDCFYASCERLREPALCGEPVVVGMGYEPGATIGAVATASYEARAFGVDSADPISAALDRLPRRVNADPEDPDAPDPEETAHYRSVDMEHYESVAADVKAVLHECGDVVREVSIDEAYLDVTDRTAWATVDDANTTEHEESAAVDAPDGRSSLAESSARGPADARTLAEGYARYVRDRIEREAGVPASVGVAPNMSTAKIASDLDKPEGLVVVPPGTVREFLAPLSTEEIHGVGPVTADRLAEMGIETAGDLAAADPDRLETILGDRGRELFARARGEDDRAVTPTGLPKSLSRESSLPATAAEATKCETVAALAADVARRASDRGCLYRTIGIKVVEPPYEVNTRERSLPGPVDDPDLVKSIALELLTEFEDEVARKLGVRVSNLDFAGSDQATLGGFETDRDGAKAGPATASRTPETSGSAPVTDEPTLTEWIERASETGNEDGDSGDTTAPTREPPDNPRDVDQRSLREFEPDER